MLTGLGFSKADSQLNRLMFFSGTVFDGFCWMESMVPQEVDTP